MQFRHLKGTEPVSRTPTSAWRAIGILAITLLGVAFFNTIIGVFGLSEAIIGLLLFVCLAILIFRRSQTEGAPQ
jgi:hypothetical protein